MGRAQWETWRQMGGNRRERVKGKGDEQDMFFSINFQPQNCFFKFWHSGDLWIKRCSSKPWPKTLTWVWPTLLALEVWCNPIGIDTSNHGYFDGDKGWLSHQHDPRIDFKLRTLNYFKGRRRYKYHKYTVTTVTIDRPWQTLLRRGAIFVQSCAIHGSGRDQCHAPLHGRGWRQRKGNRNTRRPSDVHQTSHWSLCQVSESVSTCK